MKYRAEIDGLRAFAVVPVVLFHAGLSSFSGGFIGVDVFFVISGFLITTIILNDLEGGRFSIVGFYERRSRRILPALIFIILICMPFAWIFMLPSQLKDFSQSLISVVTFSSNILFWKESGYFHAAAELKPLLHTWSLAVEEQFYIVIPVIMLALWRSGRNAVFLLVIAITTASLMASHWGSIRYPSATFYLLPTRAWELGTGSICAFLLSGRAPYKSSVMSVLGLALIIISVFIFDEATPFPSFWAMIPVGGTALVILFSGKSTVTSRFLSLRPFVWVGLISYSAYLWHQPIFAFSRIATMSEPTLATMLTLSLVSFGLAAVSWHYVEKPFRRPVQPRPRNQSNIFLLSSCALALPLLAGVLGQISNGAPFRTTSTGLSFQELDLDGRLSPNPGLGLDCIEGNSFESVVQNPRCRTGKVPSILLWGDSYAMHLAGALQKSRAFKDRSFIQIARSQCAPILGLGKNGSVVTAKECINFNDQVLSFLKGAEGIDVVIMSSPYEILGETLQDRAGNVWDQNDPSFILRQLEATANAIRSIGKIPVFVTPPPADGTDLGQCLVAAYARGLPLDKCNYQLSGIGHSKAAAFALLDKLKGDNIVIDLRESLCFEGECLTSIDGTFLYRDTGHLSKHGSEIIGYRMDPFRLLSEIL